MFKHSLQAKLTLAIAIILVVVTALIVILTGVSGSREIRSEVDEEAAAWLDSAHRLLSVTDVIMAERVKGAMALLQARGEALAPQRWVLRAHWGTSRYPICCWGHNPRWGITAWWMA